VARRRCAAAGQWRTVARGGARRRARQSSLDLELPTMVWDAVGLYAELGRRRTRLEDQEGGSDDHNDATSGEAAQPFLESTRGKERRGAHCLERR
jgi:hypothetical protein